MHFFSIIQEEQLCNMWPKWHEGDLSGKEDTIDDAELEVSGLSETAKKKKCIKLGWIFFHHIDHRAYHVLLITLFYPRIIAGTSTEEKIAETNLEVRVTTPTNQAHPVTTVPATLPPRPEMSNM